MFDKIAEEEKRFGAQFYQLTSPKQSASRQVKGEISELISLMGGLLH